MHSRDLQGYWTGTFTGTNTGGVSFGIQQNGDLLGGVATMHEPTLGTYQYLISGSQNEGIKLTLNPVSEPPGLVLGQIQASCVVDHAGILIGRWNSTLGTHGAFEARRYTEPNFKEAIKRTNVVISYSRKDSDYHDALLVHLKPAQKLGLIDAWSDQRILTGDLWKKEIEAALARAHVAILIVSPDFLASDFIVNNELPPLLKRAKDEGVRILPLIARPCRFTRDENLNVFQTVNNPQEPLSSMDQHGCDQTYDAVAKLVEEYKP